MGKKSEKKVFAAGTQKLLQRAPVPAEMGKEKMRYQAVKYACENDDKHAGNISWLNIMNITNHHRISLSH